MSPRFKEMILILKYLKGEHPLTTNDMINKRTGVVQKGNLRRATERISRSVLREKERQRDSTC